jgi:hypothetical protein
MLPPLLQFALVRPETIQVAYQISPVLFLYDKEYLGADPEPNALPKLWRSSVVRRLASSMAADTLQTRQPRMWSEAITGSEYDAQHAEARLKGITTMGDAVRSSDRLSVFSSAFPSNTDTGVRRFHSMRLNSSAECLPIPAQDFPETCDGDMPFEGDYMAKAGEEDAVRVRWCVPGNYSRYPFSDSRDRQDIAEELFLDVSVVMEGIVGSSYPSHKINFTIACTGNTTRGYFELPNHFNQHRPGPLLDVWPSNDEIQQNFDDEIYEWDPEE